MKTIRLAVTPSRLAFAEVLKDFSTTTPRGGRTLSGFVEAFHIAEPSGGGQGRAQPLLVAGHEVGRLPVPPQGEGFRPREHGAY